MSSSVTVVTKGKTVVTPAAKQAVVFTSHTTIVTHAPPTQVVKTPSPRVLVVSRRGDPGERGLPGEDGDPGADGPIEVFVQQAEPLTTKPSLWIETNVGGDPTKFTVWFGESA